MDPKTLLISQLNGGRSLLMQAAGTLNDNDFIVRLPNAGECADWIFGHLTANEDWFLSVLTGSQIHFPKELADTYIKDYPSAWHLNGTWTRTQLLDMFQEQRARVIEAVSGADYSMWDNPAPAGFPPVFNTLGSVWGILGTHQFWHLGQLMSIRAMLGKPAF